jgi:hypothetical protein
MQARLKETDSCISVGGFSQFTLSQSIPCPLVDMAQLAPHSKKGVQVDVQYNGIRYRYPARVDVERYSYVKDLMVLMMQKLGWFSRGSRARVPAMTSPREAFMVEKLPLAVVNVPKNMRAHLAAALKVRDLG